MQYRRHTANSPQKRNNSGCFAVERRAFLKSAVLTGGLVLQQAALPGFLLAANTASLPEKDVPEAHKDAVFFDRAEKQTQVYLKQIEQALKLRLEKDDQPMFEALRMWCIRFSMRPNMADKVSDLLNLLGESTKTREDASFFMPVVRWMSEPFLFPVETEGTPEEQKKEIEKIFKLMRDLQSQGFTSSLDNVGDASLSPEDAKKYEEYYASLIRAFIASQKQPQLYMSVKLSALVHDLKAALGTGKKAAAKQQEITAALTSLLQLAAQAPEKDIFLRIDMEEYAYKDLTLRIFREIVENNQDIACNASGSLRLGVVIQAYLRDAAQDVRMLTEWARARKQRVPIRLVKGAYLDYERAEAAAKGSPSPVWDNKPSTDANYEAVSAYILLNLDAVTPAFATHNIRTQAHAMALAEVFGLSPQMRPFRCSTAWATPSNTSSLPWAARSESIFLRDHWPEG